MHLNMILCFHCYGILTLWISHTTEEVDQNGSEAVPSYVLPPMPFEYFHDPLIFAA
jgi:hypothetical protein